MKRVLPLWLIVFCSSFALANSQVDFIAVVGDSITEDDGTVVLQMRLSSDFVLPVRVTGDTELFDENDDELQIEELKKELLLRIKGFFTSEGIHASEIIVKEDDSGFRITGVIQDILDGRQIVIGGVPITVREDAEIKGGERDLVEFADLQVGQRVRAKGDIVEGSFEAFEVKFRSSQGPAPRIRFEGIVASITGDEIRVTIEGVGDAVVIITGDTKIEGTLAVGVFVRILGTINPNLAVEATNITARQRLRVAPHELRMRFEQTRRVEVILRESFDDNVTLSIESANPDIASPSADSLTIEAGKVTGAFEVTSGMVEGETVITVQMPAGETATVEMEVQDRDEPRDEDLEIHWRPDDIRLQPGHEREVSLRLHGPAPAGGLDVTLSLQRGAEGLVEFPQVVIIPEGEHVAKVMIASLGEPGEVKIRAQLTDSVGGDDDDLEVQIRGEKERDEDRENRDDEEDRDEAETEIRWSPREIEMEFNDSRTVQLTLSQEKPEEVVVTLSIKDGPADAVGFPLEVAFPAGVTSVDVEIATGDTAGDVKVRVALPFNVGGDTDDLEVIVRAGD